MVRQLPGSARFNLPAPFRADRWRNPEDLGLRLGMRLCRTNPNTLKSSPAASAGGAMVPSRSSPWSSRDHATWHDRLRRRAAARRLTEPSVQVEATDVPGRPNRRQSRRRSRRRQSRPRSRTARARAGTPARPQNAGGRGAEGSARRRAGKKPAWQLPSPPRDASR